MKIQNKEEWKYVVGWDGAYSVSSFGRVKSNYRKITHKNGFIQTISGKILKGSINFYGYRFVDLCRGKQRKNTAIHILVMQEFVGPRPRACDICHNDGDKLNNNISNLRYGTRTENNHDKVLHGRLPIGDLHWNVKIPDKDIPKILQSSKTKTELAKKYGVSWACIHDIKTYRRRKIVERYLQFG